MSKILKNTTGSTVFIADTGISISPSPGQYTIPATDYLLWAASSNVVTKVGDGSLIVNDGSSDLSITDGIDLIKGIFSKKITGGTDGTTIGNVGDRLKVDTIISPSTGSVPTVSKKLRYDDMNAGTGGIARGTSVTNSTWSTIYYCACNGILMSMVINLEDKNNWQIRMVVDGEEVFGADGLKTTDLVNDTAYDLDDAGSPLSANEGNIGISLEEHDRFIWVCPTSFPIRYDSSIEIKIKRIAGQASKKFNAGLIILTKE